MESIAHTVSAQVAHYAIVILVGMFLNGIANVANKAIGLGCLHAYLQTLLCHTHQLLLLRSGLANDEHTGSIGIIAIEYSGAVDVYDVSLAKYILSLGNAVANHLVDACAYTLGKSLIVEWSRFTSMLCGVVIDNLVYLEC